MSCQKCEILYFDRLLLSKSNTVSVKKAKESYLSWHWRVMQSLKKSWLVVSNGMWSLVNFHPTTQKSENFTSMGYFCPYYRRFELKNTEELSSMRLDSDAKFDLVVSKMAWGIGWTFIRALKSLKNCVLMGSFSPKHMFQLEHFRGIMSWHGRVRQDLKENWLVACKRIWLIFMSTV